MRKFAIALLVSGCAGAHPALRDGDDLRGQLMQADRDFNRASTERGIEGFRSFLLPDVAGLAGEPRRGAAALAESWTPLLSGGGVSMTWEPSQAGFVESAQLGWTIGRYLYKKGDASSTGSYVTVWKRQADGSWKVALDTGAPDCPVGGGCAPLVGRSPPSLPLLTARLRAGPPFERPCPWPALPRIDAFPGGR